MIHRVHRVVWSGAVLFALLWLSGCATSPTPAPSEDVWMPLSGEPDNRRRARIRVELAAGYLQQGQLTVALDETRLALQADPNFAPAHTVRGLILLQMNQSQTAEESFQQALRLAPRDGDTWHNLGWLYCQGARYDDARRAFSTALQAPNYAGAARTWMVQGICEAREGRKADAERSLANALQMDATNPIALYNLALLTHQRGDHERARFYLRRLNASESANAESLWLGAKVEQQLQNREGAEQLGRQLVRRFPDSREASAFERGAFNE